MSPDTRRVKRTRGKGSHLPPGTKSVARPSRWGSRYVWTDDNMAPGRVRVADRAEALARYRAEKLAHPKLAEHLAPLLGFRLACYCDLTDPCHVDVLLDIIDDMATTTQGGMS